MRQPDPLCPHLRFFTRASLRRLLAELGFEVESLSLQVELPKLVSPTLDRL